MINYATQNNVPWDGIENLFIDSGGYSFMMGMGEYKTSDAAYLRFIREHQPDLFALRDYPCEPDVLEKHDQTVEDHQRMTIDRHRVLMDMWEDQWWVKSEPVTVLQGWELDDYLTHLDEMREHGVLQEYVAIGSVCRRGMDEEIRDIVLAVREELESKHKLHAFGVKMNILQYPDALKALDSCDSMAYEFGEQFGNRVSGTKRKSFRDSALEYLKFKKKVNQITRTPSDC